MKNYEITYRIDDPSAYRIFRTTERDLADEFFAACITNGYLSADYRAVEELAAFNCNTPTHGGHDECPSR